MIALEKDENLTLRNIKLRHIPYPNSLSFKLIKEDPNLSCDYYINLISSSWYIDRCIYIHIYARNLEALREAIDDMNDKDNTIIMHYNRSDYLFLSDTLKYATSYNMYKDNAGWVTYIFKILMRGIL